MTQQRANETKKKPATKASSSSQARRNAGRSSRTSVEEEAVKHARPGQSQDKDDCIQEKSRHTEHGPCEVKGDFDKSKRAGEIFNKKPSDHKANYEAEAHPARRSV